MIVRFLALAILLVPGFVASGVEASPTPGAVIVAEPGVKLYEEAEARKTNNQFVIYIPPSYKAGTAMPLIVNASRNGPRLIAEWQKYADEFGFIVVCPTFVSMEGGSLEVFHERLKVDEKMLVNVMQRVFAALAIDREHVLFTGLSAGAFPTWYIAPKHPDIFTALCFRSGNFPGPLEDLTASLEKWKQRPIYLYWGEKDRPNVYAENVNALKYLQETIKTEKLKHEIVPGGGHTSRADLASKWFDSVIKGTTAPDAR